MILLDTNIFIYIVSGALDRELISDTDIAHASITKIEALGFQDIQVNDQTLLKQLFNESYVLPLIDVVIEQAITLRQLKKMSLGDAIIAATALTYDLELWTANLKDFEHINNLKLVNPFKK